VNEFVRRAADLAVDVGGDPVRIFTAAIINVIGVQAGGRYRVNQPTLIVISIVLNVAHGVRGSWREGADWWSRRNNPREFRRVARFAESGSGRYKYRRLF